MAEEAMLGRHIASYGLLAAVCGGPAADVSASSRTSCGALEERGWSVPLVVGEHLRVWIDSTSRARVELHAPSRTVVATTEGRGRFFLATAATEDGEHSIEVTCDAGAAPPVVSIETYVGPDLEDRLELERRFRWASVLSEHLRHVERRRAASELARVAAEADLKRDTSLELESLLRLGRLQRELGDFAASRRCFRAVRTSAAGVRVIDADLGHAMTEVYADRPEKARGFAESARAASAAAGDGRREAQAWVATGLALQAAGAADEALGWFTRALDRFREVPSGPGEASALLHQGFALSDLSREREAVESHTAALSRYRVDQDRRGEALALLGLGHAWSKLGEKQEALRRYEQAEPLLTWMDDPYWSPALLGGFALVHSELGDWETAARYYEGALALNRRLGSSWGQAASLIMLARARRILGEPERARADLDQAIAAVERMGAPRLLAATLTETAAVHVDLGDMDAASSHLERARSLSRTVGFSRQEIEALLRLGELEADAGRWDASEARLDEALSQSASIEFPLGQVRALVALAELSQRQGQLDDALARSAEALGHVEALRARVDSPELRTAFFESVRDLQDLHIEVLMGLHAVEPDAGHHIAAFESAESARARTLYEQLDDLDFLDSASEGAARSPSAPRLPSVQEALDDDTTLLAFHLGRRRGTLWAVTPGALRTYDLGKASEVRELAKSAYEHLKPLERRPDESRAELRARVADAEEAYWARATELSDKALRPAFAELAGKRLLIVGDGPLHRIPFSALPDPTGQGREPLVARYEVVRLPSASSLPLLDARRRSRAEPSKTLAVVADPVFSADDPRLPARSSRSADTDGEAGLRSASHDWPRLLGSRDEARAILDRVAPDQRLGALGFDASLSLLTDGTLREYRYVHFATHGVVDIEEPGRSGVVLSLYDEQGARREGFLRLHDLYGLELPVDLVVLSACGTALGRESRAEGPLGLVRGFLSAGASGVVASYWDVDDGATSELMQRFYRNVLAGTMEPGAALRNAQRTMALDERWASPSHWAAFELHGPWN